MLKHSFFPEEMHKDSAHQIQKLLRSLEGCPDGLKSLIVSDGRYIKSLVPLLACKELETLQINYAYEFFDLSPLSPLTRLTSLILRVGKVTDLSPLSSMVLLEELNLSGIELVQDISSLSHCRSLRKLNLGGNGSIEGDTN